MPHVGTAKPFSTEDEEDVLTVRYQETYGKHWSAIAEFLSCRIDKLSPPQAVQEHDHPWRWYAGGRPEGLTLTVSRAAWSSWEACQ